MSLAAAKLPATDSARILIVDDDAGQRSLLDSFLRSQGFETVVASSGEEALGVLREHEFQMMISDVRMPGISGLETLRRARHEHGMLPVLLVTAYSDVRDAVAAMRDGAVKLPQQAHRFGRVAPLGAAGDRAGPDRAGAFHGEPPVAAPYRGAQPLAAGGVPGRLARGAFGKPDPDHRGKRRGARRWWRK